MALEAAEAAAAAAEAAAAEAAVAPGLQGRRHAAEAAVKKAAAAVAAAAARVAEVAGAAGVVARLGGAVVKGETSARMNLREGEVAVFRLWPSCRTATLGTAEQRHFRLAAAQVACGGMGHGLTIVHFPA